MTNRLPCLLLFAAAVLPAGARADSVYLGSLPFSNITITNVADGKITFENVGGTDKSLDLSRVTHIDVEGLPDFNAADTAFAEGRFADAVDGYLKAYRSPPKDWLKQYIAPRLLEAGQKSNRFDASAAVYIGMLLRDPAGATKSRPAMPDASSTYLDTALEMTNNALSQPNLSDAQRIALLNYSVQLSRAKNDATTADATEARLEELLAKDPNNPLALKATARRAVQSAQQALASRQYQAAISTIQENRARFTDAPMQADALFILAQAKDALAESSRDKAALEDAALAYMRVVAHFKDATGRPHVGESLAQTALIEEQIGEPKVARQLDEQIVAQFPDRPDLVTAAKANIERLKQMGGDAATQPAVTQPPQS